MEIISAFRSEASVSLGEPTNCASTSGDAAKIWHEMAELLARCEKHRSGLEVVPLGAGAGEVVGDLVAVLILDIDSRAVLVVVPAGTPVDVDLVVADHKRGRGVLTRMVSVLLHSVCTVKLGGLWGCQPLPALASPAKDRGHEHDRGKELHRKIRKGGEVVQVEMFGGASFCVVGTMLDDLESGGKSSSFIPFE
ncbi:hypothetical protein L1887_47121 [Cichorium endivia]|nr:hypothetical protein L1887_47121 [Cichorium endivia]